jgi:hypothetical protein
MMLNVMGLYCCGWAETSGITRYATGDLNEFLRELVYKGFIYSRGVQRGALLFTQAGTKSAYGKRLAKDIVDAGLGKVQVLDTFTNPNTRHVITPFMWIIDKDALLSYCFNKGILT